MFLIDTYWSVIFSVMRWLAHHQMSTQNVPYQIIMWLIHNDMRHIGGSWNYTQHVFDINPDLDIVED
jgi:hypothetical protein